MYCKITLVWLDTSLSTQIRRHCDVAMNCDGEVMDFDCRVMSFYEKYHVAILLNPNCTLMAYRIVSTIEAPNRGPPHGHNGKYMPMAMTILFI